MTPKKRIFFLGGMIVLVAILWLGFYLYNKPRQSAAGETSSGSVEAAVLYQEYEQNEQAANQKYLGKIIEVSGKLSSVSQESGAEIWILSASAPGPGISCQLFSKPPASLQPTIGNVYTIKGKCTGFLMDVNLVDCIIK
jgi:tRNA_anti-like